MSSRRNLLGNHLKIGHPGACILVVLAVITASCNSGDLSAPELPKVFIYGDSIRAGYEQPLRHMLDRQADVWSMGPVNGDDSAHMIATLLTLQPAPLPNPVPSLADFNVIALNAGIHDAVGFEAGGVPTSNANYEANFKSALDLIEVLNPKAQIILITSTPFASSPNSVATNEIIDAYNSILKDLANSRPNVTICDLNKFVLETATPDSYVDIVHFTPAYFKRLAGEVHASIFETLH